MVKTLILALAIAGSIAGVARGDTLVFPVEGADTTTNTRLTRALLAGADRDTPRLADTPLGEAASLLECNPAEAACLDSMAQAMEASALLAASVRPAGATLAVHITYHRRGQGSKTRDAELPAGAEAAAPVLEREVRALIGGENAGSAPPPATAAPVAPREDAAVGATSDGGAGFSLGRVRPWSWAIAGTGLVLVGVGTAFAFKASGLESDVEAAPRDTVMDLEHLKNLEDQGESATSISNVLLIGGGVALLAGATLVIWQGFTPGAEERGRALTVTPTALRGGAGLVLSGELP